MRFTTRDILQVLRERRNFIFVVKMILSRLFNRIINIFFFGRSIVKWSWKIKKKRKRFLLNTIHYSFLSEADKKFSSNFITIFSFTFTPKMWSWNDKIIEPKQSENISFRVNNFNSKKKLLLLLLSIKFFLILKKKNNNPCITPKNTKINVK